MTPEYYYTYSQFRVCVYKSCFQERVIVDSSQHNGTIILLNHDLLLSLSSMCFGTFQAKDEGTKAFHLCQNEQAYFSLYMHTVYISRQYLLILFISVFLLFITVKRFYLHFPADLFTCSFTVLTNAIQAFYWGTKSHQFIQ